MNEQIYTNYRLQLPDQEILGTLVVRDGRIAEIQPGTVATGQNGNGDYLMPGLIELHTDNLESCISPRPSVRFPLDAATTYHDRQVASAGITTVCDAIAIGDFDPDSPRLTQFTSMIEAVYHGQKTNRFSVDHRLHLRCELSYEHAYTVVEQHIDNPLVSLISLMDHTPGQRQFVRLDKYREYYMGKRGFTAEQVDNQIQALQELQLHYSDKNRTSLVELAQAHEVSIASHDDATLEHVQAAIADGASIAEFPTTLEAAHASHTAGLQVLMGAPNLVLGRSHSGNISAAELLEHNLVDVISSDYVPQSLLQAVFIAADKTGKPIYEAMRLATSNPADAIDLSHDRGSLDIGKRADLITVHFDGIVPRVRSVVCQGQRVA
jgi:alpha-D-ribose 1-methylphosphonate 5-triphosphate diphosphatase